MMRKTAAERQAEMLAHPVREALKLGLLWGLPLAVVSAVFDGRHRIMFALGFWLTVGLLFFGPLVVWWTRRKSIRGHG